MTTMIPPRSPRVGSSLRSVVLLSEKLGRHLARRPLREGQNPLDLARQLLRATEAELQSPA
jgi:hypothetical protein